MPNPVVHWEIAAKNDARKLEEFYSDLFGWHVDSNNPLTYVVVDTGSKEGINGGICNSGIIHRHAISGVTFYVQVDNPQAFLDRVESLGGETVMRPVVIPNMVTKAIFADPEGNIIGLLKR